MIPSGCLSWPKGQIQEGIMSTQPQRALLLRSIVSRFEQRVNEFLDYADSHPDATFSDLEAQTRRLSRDCLAPALEAVVQAHQASVEALVKCSCARVADYKGQQPRSQETYVGASGGGEATTTVPSAGRGATHWTKLWTLGLVPSVRGYKLECPDWGQLCPSRLRLRLSVH